MIKNITNLGDAALYCDFGDKVNKEINLNVINCFKNLQKAKIKGITNISPSYNLSLIHLSEPSRRYAMWWAVVWL